MYMRNFCCNDKKIERFASNNLCIDDEPAFALPAYAQCLYDTLVDGSIMYHDMVSVLQDVDKFVERVGPSVVQDLMYQLQPQPLQPMDNMTDDQRFDCVVSRYCQTMSERASLLQYLTDEHKDLLSQYQLGESDSTPAQAIATESSQNE